MFEIYTVADGARLGKKVGEAATEAEALALVLAESGYPEGAMVMRDRDSAIDHGNGFGARMPGQTPWYVEPTYTVYSKNGQVIAFTWWVWPRPRTRS